MPDGVASHVRGTSVTNAAKMVSLAANATRRWLSSRDHVRARTCASRHATMMSLATPVGTYVSTDGMNVRSPRWGDAGSTCVCVCVKER